MSNTHPNPESRPNFATTHWNLVVSAGGTEADSESSRNAMEWLCKAYWMPLYSYVRRRVHDVNDAQDLTQAFFERLLDKDYLAKADPKRGRFRAFLLTAFKHFLANEWDKSKTQKRGGDKRVLSLDFTVGESWHASLPSDATDAETLFERQWAQALLNRVLQRLQREQDRAGRAKQFAVLKDFIAGRVDGASVKGRATELGMTDAAARMAVSRLRERYRELLRAEIAETVGSPEEVDSEIAHLFSVFAS